MVVSLAVAFILGFENPYWIPISCLAVMQGSSSRHIWLRAVQRIIGISHHFPVRTRKAINTGHR